ncbi:3598_t:CDS:2, partial [Acaulospora colombiana]
LAIVLSQPHATSVSSRELFCSTSVSMGDGLSAGVDSTLSPNLCVACIPLVQHIIQNDLEEQADSIAVKQYWMDMEKKQVDDLISFEETRQKIHEIKVTYYEKQLQKLLKNGIRNDNVANVYFKGTSSEKVKEPQENGKSACKDNLKRKRDAEDPDY